MQIPVLKYFRQAENQGISKNTDRCLRSATGDFIVRLDSDDYFHPKYIEKLAGLLNDHKDAGYAHCAVQEIDQNNKLLKERLLFRKDVYQSAGEALKAAAQGYRVAANIIMFRKEALIRAEYLAGRSNFAEDYHLTATISSLGFGNAYHNEVLAYYRVWIDEGKVRQKRKLAEIDGLRRVFDEVLEPAFKKREWPLNSIVKSRAKYACIQADCLGWGIYNAGEKQQLALELSKLSSSNKAKLTAWMHLNQVGFILNGYEKLVKFSKHIAKKLIPAPGSK